MLHLVVQETGVNGFMRIKHLCTNCSGVISYSVLVNGVYCPKCHNYQEGSRYYFTPYMRVHYHVSQESIDTFYD